MSVGENGRTLSDQPGFEFHDPAFDPLTGEGGVSIWVLIESSGC